MSMKMKNREGKGLRPPFREPFLLSASDFIRHCVDRGLRISHAFLERYEENGFLYPAVRVFFPIHKIAMGEGTKKIGYQIGYIHRERIATPAELNNEKIVRYGGQWLAAYKHEFPYDHSFRPWSTYALKVDYGTSKKALGTPAETYYTSEQVYVVDIIKRALCLEIEKVVKVDLDQLKGPINDQYLINALFYSAQAAYSEMLAATQCCIDRQVSKFGGTTNKELGSRPADYRATQRRWEDDLLSKKASDVLLDLGVDTAKAEALLRWFYQRGWNQDPLIESWKAVSEYVPTKLFNRAKGALLLSLNHYDQAARIGWFLQKLVNPDIDTLYAQQWGDMSDRCRRCGMPFKKNPSRRGGRKQVTCSHECGELNKQEVKRIKRLGRRSVEL